MTSHASPKLSRAWVVDCRSEKRPWVHHTSYTFHLVDTFDMSLSQVAFGTQVCTEISWSLCLTARMLVTCWAYFPTRVKELVSSTWIVDSLHWTLVAFGIRFFFPLHPGVLQLPTNNLWIYCLEMFPVRELTYCHIAFIIEVMLYKQHTWPTLLVKFSRHFPSEIPSQVTNTDGALQVQDSQGKWLDVPPTNGLVAFDARLVVVNPQTPPPKKIGHAFAL